MDTVLQEHLISNPTEMNHPHYYYKDDDDSPVYSNDSSSTVSVVAHLSSGGERHEPPAPEETETETDYSDAILKYISQMMMEEEDLEHMPCMFYDCMALQATEKSFYNALNDDVLNIPPRAADGLSGGDPGDGGGKNKYESGRKHPREEKGSDSTEESDPMDMFDCFLVCQDTNYGDQSVLDTCLFPEGQPTDHRAKRKKGSRQRIPSGARQTSPMDLVDLRGLLMQCAQAVASYETRTASELFRKIRVHSTPSGDATQRLAHYFTNALEARLAGTGTALYTTFDLEKYPATELLKAQHAYVIACPFKRMSNIYANKCIKKVARGAKKLHIIDFGILYGFQWPCLIRVLSERPGGPPELRITGIEFPQRGANPAGRVEQTGRRLEKYCKMFNVPFRYTAIAKRWESIKVEDLNIEKDELVVVNCLYRLGNVLDETVVSTSPRDTVLRLIKRIKPEIFVHGVTNGTYNSPFFQTRFREALFHFSSLFDMFDATIPRGNHERMLYEKEVLGRDSMNIIACEGTERVARSETYKLWQVRNQRCGLRQLPLDCEVVSYVRDKVKRFYHEDFVVEEDGNWMLQGWKGKVIYALSCWKSSKK